LSNETGHVSKESIDSPHYTPVDIRMFEYDDVHSRRQLERQVIDEGTAVWRQKKALDAAKENEDRKQVRIPIGTLTIRHPSTHYAKCNFPKGTCIAFNS